MLLISKLITRETIARRLNTIVALSLTLASCPCLATNKNNNHNQNSYICDENEGVGDTPIYIFKLGICNFDQGNPVDVYSIKMNEEPTSDNRYCLKGDQLSKFKITNENEIKLIEKLDGTELTLKLHLMKVRNSDTPSEQKIAINAIELELSINDCNKVTWQTIAVVVLSSICIILVSTLAIMLILYQQKGLIGLSREENDQRAEDLNYQPDLRGDTFINPRRTSSYEFSSLSRHSTSSTL